MPKTNAQNKLKVDGLVAMFKKELLENLSRINDGTILIKAELKLNRSGIRSTKIYSGVDYSV